MKIKPLTQPRQRNVHPGELLREEFLSPLGITPSRLAKEAKLPHQLVTEIVNEKRGVTTNTDRHLCAYFGQTPGYWLRVQLAYDRRGGAHVRPVPDEKSKGRNPWAASMLGKKPRKRTLLPEFEKLMSGKPGDDVQAALDEDRGDDPGIVRKLTNTHELADFAEAELALSSSQTPLPTLVASVFPDRRSAARWLKAPCSGLQGRIPARMAKTRKGRAEVKAFLIGVGTGNFM